MEISNYTYDKRTELFWRKNVQALDIKDFCSIMIYNAKAHNEPLADLDLSLSRKSSFADRNFNSTSIITLKAGARHTKGFINPLYIEIDTDDKKISLKQFFPHTRQSGQLAQMLANLVKVSEKLKYNEIYIWDISSKDLIRKYEELGAIEGESSKDRKLILNDTTLSKLNSYFLKKGVSAQPETMVQKQNLSFTPMVSLNQQNLGT